MKLFSHWRRNIPTKSMTSETVCWKSHRSQKVFNYRLSRSRDKIENTFGILVSHWQIFRHPIKAKIDWMSECLEDT